MAARAAPRSPTARKPPATKQPTQRPPRPPGEATSTSRTTSAKRVNNKGKAPARTSPSPSVTATAAALPPTVTDVSPPPTSPTEECEALNDPVLRRGLSNQLAQMENTLRDPISFVRAQRQDPALQLQLARLEAGRAAHTDCVLADDDNLWHAPRGQRYAIAVPQQLVPAVLALIHGTYGHPGSARTPILIEQKYHWPTLKKDVRAYVLSCKCRRRKRAWSRQLSIMPARLLQPWEVLQMDIQDMKVKLDKGNQYLLLVVDRASKFLAVFPLPTKEALGVSRKLLQLILMFGLPLYLSCDPGGENIGTVMHHMCLWLNVSLRYGPSNHPRSQGLVERMGGWLQETLTSLCDRWPHRWCSYVPVATWIHRTLPDASLPGAASPFRVLFGRRPRSHIDVVAHALDSASLGDGLDRTIMDQHKMTQEILEQRQVTLNAQRERFNAKISREPPGARAPVGDLVLVKETATALHRDRHHPKLAHEHFTGPWTVVSVVQDRFCFTVQVNGRRVRQRKVAATDIKPFHSRPADLRLPFEDEFTTLVWSADLALPDISVVAVPLYTLLERRVLRAEHQPTSWSWEYRGRYQDGAISPWLTEDEAGDSFSPLQLDVFHALWEHLRPGEAPRPAGPPSRGQREMESRERALDIYPKGTVVGRIFTDSSGQSKVFKAKVYYYCDPYWRVEYTDGDWEELTKREIDQGIGFAAHPQPLA